MTAATRHWTPFLALETASLLSAVGNGIAMVALPWLVLQRTGSPAAAGLVGGVAALPLLLASLFSGTVVDRVGRRRTSVVSDVLSGLSVAAIPVVAYVGDLTLTWLVVLAALGAVFDPAGATARETMLPEAAAAAGIPLERANGIHEAVFGTAFLVAPGLGGLLLAVVGAETTLWATALGFALSAAVIALVRVPGAGRPPADVRRHGFVKETFDGLRFVWHDRVLRVIAVLFTLLVGAWLPVEGVILPVHFQTQDAPERLGLTIMAMSAGGLVGALAYSAVGPRLRRRPAVLVSLVGTALAVVGMAVLPPFPVLLAFGFLTGLFYGPINPLTNLAMQERTPSALRGRVVGVITSLAYAAGPVGLLVSGVVVEQIGLRPTFVALAVIILVVALSALPLRALADLDHPPPPESVGLPDTLPVTRVPITRVPPDAEQVPHSTP